MGVKRVRDLAVYAIASSPPSSIDPAHRRSRRRGGGGDSQRLRFAADCGDRVVAHGSDFQDHAEEASSIRRAAAALNNYAVQVYARGRRSASSSSSSSSSSLQASSSASLRLFRQARDSFVKAVALRSAEKSGAVKGVAPGGGANGYDERRPPEMHPASSSVEFVPAKRRKVTWKNGRVDRSDKGATAQQRRSGLCNDDEKKPKQKPQFDSCQRSKNDGEIDVAATVVDECSLGLYREETDDHSGTVRFCRPRTVRSADVEEDEMSAALRGAAVATYNMAVVRPAASSSVAAATAAAAEADPPSSARELLESSLSHLRLIPSHCFTSADVHLEIEIHNNIAWLCVEEGREDGAVEAYIRALEVRPAAGSRVGVQSGAEAASGETKRREPEEGTGFGVGVGVASHAAATDTTEVGGTVADSPTAAATTAAMNAATASSRLSALLSTAIVRLASSANATAAAAVAVARGNSSSASNPDTDAATSASAPVPRCKKDGKDDGYLLRQSIISSNLGQIHLRSGRYVDAANACRAADALRMAVLGDGHLLTAVCRYNYGLLLHRVGDLVGAGRYYASFLSVAESWMAVDEDGSGRVGGAGSDDGEKRGLEGCRDFDGNIVLPMTGRSLRSSVATAQHQSGLILNALGDPRGAVRTLEGVLSARRRLYGDVHPDVAKTLFSLGQVAFELGRYSDSALYFEDTLRVSRRLKLDPAHMIFVFALSYVGQIRQRAGDADGALRLYSEALGLAIRAFGEAHYVAINLLNALGNVRLGRGERRAASKCFARAAGMYVISIMRGGVGIGVGGGNSGGNAGGAKGAVANGAKPEDVNGYTVITTCRTVGATAA